MKRELTVDLILRTAENLALEKGFDSISLRPLAASLNVTATAIYYHVSDKNTLLELVAERLFEPVFIPDSGLHWTERMRLFLLSQNELLHRVPGLARFMIMRRECEAAMIWRRRLFSILNDAGFSGEALDAAIAAFSFYIDPTTLVGAVPGEQFRLDMTEDGHQPGMTYPDYYQLGLDRLLTAFDNELRSGR